MATFILKSLGIGYALMVIVFLVGLGGHWAALIAPIMVWPAYLIVSGLVALVLKAIDEQKAAKTHNHK